MENGENKKQKKKADILQWNKTKWTVPRETKIKEKNLAPKSETLKTRSSPMQFCREFVNDGILEHIKLTSMQLNNLNIKVVNR